MTHPNGCPMMLVYWWSNGDPFIYLFVNGGLVPKVPTVGMMEKHDPFQRSQVPCPCQWGTICRNTFFLFLPRPFLDPWRLGENHLTFFQGLLCTKTSKLLTILIYIYIYIFHPLNSDIFPAQKGTCSKPWVTVQCTVTCHDLQVLFCDSTLWGYNRWIFPRRMYGHSSCPTAATKKKKHYKGEKRNRTTNIFDQAGVSSTNVFKRAHCIVPG